MYAYLIAATAVLIYNAALLVTRLVTGDLSPVFATFGILGVFIVILISLFSHTVRNAYAGSIALLLSSFAALFYTIADFEAGVFDWIFLSLWLLLTALNVWTAIVHTRWLGVTRKTFLKRETLLSDVSPRGRRGV